MSLGTLTAVWGHLKTLMSVYYHTSLKGREFWSDKCLYLWISEAFGHLRLVGSIDYFTKAPVAPRGLGPRPRFRLFWGNAQLLSTPPVNTVNAHTWHLNLQERHCVCDKQRDGVSRVSGCPLTSHLKRRRLHRLAAVLASFLPFLPSFFSLTSSRVKCSPLVSLKYVSISPDMKLLSQQAYTISHIALPRSTSLYLWHF